jgi:ABC-type multidrug transport system permease subunit/outer membrane murein-binding lipoprotein Lpp
MRAFLSLLVKDLQLLWRDRVGLVFLALAPLAVITVAGLSLSNLYGADPTGQTAYELPLADEDGGALGREIRSRLAGEQAVRLRPVESRTEAERLVRKKQAGTALVIPGGTQEALDAGRPASLVLYTDAVKYLERLNVRLRLLELRDALQAERLKTTQDDAGSQRDRLAQQLDRLRDEMSAARSRLNAAWQEATRARDEATRTAQASLTRQLAAAGNAYVERAARELDRQLAEVRSYLDAVAARRHDFEAWLAELRRLAGSHAQDIPPPPAFPEPPASLTQLLATGPVLPKPEPPAVQLPSPPPLPKPPVLALPDIDLPAAPHVPGRLDFEERDVSGGSSHINTFDQNVPGFSVTFLLLGMLLGVSLGLLDERDWGTLDRLRAMPVSVSRVLGAKLLARFLVGVVQMILLFAVGRALFGISLGPQPWLLLLPTAAIVFAGTAFGLVVAALATSREAVLPIGSIAIVTMAAVGGCWWPIDLEPRWMRQVALAFPTTWAMEAFNDLMIRRRGLDAALRPAAVMGAYGVFYLLAGTALFRWRLNRT